MTIEAPTRCELGFHVVLKVLAPRATILSTEIAWNLMLKGLSRFVALFAGLFVALSSASYAQTPSWYMREGKFPPMVTTRADVERLFAELVAIARALPPEETYVHGEPVVTIFGITTGGLGTSRNVPAAQALDTLHRYLVSRANFKALGLSFHDSRGYSAIAGSIHYPRVSGVSLAPVSSAERPYRGYRVDGYDREQVDRIADRIEAFGRTFETWRTYERGEVIKSCLRVLAVLMLPMALAFRERRLAWLLYPTSAALAAASYLIPFAALFGNATLVAIRS